MSRISFGQLGAVANRGVEIVLRCPDILQLCPGVVALALSLVSLVSLTPAVDPCVHNTLVLNTTCVSPVTMVIA